MWLAALSEMLQRHSDHDLIMQLHYLKHIEKDIWMLPILTTDIPLQYKIMWAWSHYFYFHKKASSLPLSLQVSKQLLYNACIKSIGNKLNMMINLLPLIYVQHAASAFLSCETRLLNPSDLQEHVGSIHPHVPVQHRVIHVVTGHPTQIKHQAGSWMLHHHGDNKPEIIIKADSEGMNLQHLKQTKNEYLVFF